MFGKRVTEFFKLEGVSFGLKLAQVASLGLKHNAEICGRLILADQFLKESESERGRKANPMALSKALKQVINSLA